MNSSPRVSAVSGVEKPAPLDAAGLERRLIEIGNVRAYRDHPGRVELNEFGEVLVNPPVGVPHSRTAVRLARLLEDELGGHCMVEVGVITDIGLRGPDVVWCSDGFLQQHPEQVALRAAPEICIEVVLPNDSLRELREKVQSYLRAGAHEAWIVDPKAATVEIHRTDGVSATSRFPVDVSRLFAAD